MARVITPQKEIDQIFDRSTRQLSDAMLNFATAVFRRNADQIEKYGNEVATVIQTSQALADLLGRRRFLLEMDELMRRNAPTSVSMSARGDVHRQHYDVEGVAPILPVPFEEAIASITEREPRLAAAAQEVEANYKSARIFQVSKAPTVEITQRVQKAISDAVRAGTPLNEASALIQDIGRFTRAYSDTVFRTNVSAAYSAGRLKQVQDPAVREVVPAFRYDAVEDADVRPNHVAADGLIAGVDDPVWDVFTPPLGYNCRCTLQLMDVFTLQRAGLISRSGEVDRVTPRSFAAAHPDPGFGTSRPDRRMYGA